MMMIMMMMCMLAQSYSFTGTNPDAPQSPALPGSNGSGAVFHSQDVGLITVTPRGMRHCYNKNSVIRDISIWFGWLSYVHQVSNIAYSE